MSANENGRHQKRSRWGLHLLFLLAVVDSTERVADRFLTSVLRKPYMKLENVKQRTAEFRRMVSLRWVLFIE